MRAGTCDHLLLGCSGAVRDAQAATSILSLPSLKAERKNTFSQSSFFHYVWALIWRAKSRKEKRIIFDKVFRMKNENAARLWPPAIAVFHDWNRSESKNCSFDSLRAQKVFAKGASSDLDWISANIHLFDVHRPFISAAAELSLCCRSEVRLKAGWFLSSGCPPTHSSSLTRSLSTNISGVRWFMGDISVTLAPIKCLYNHSFFIALSSVASSSVSSVSWCLFN